MKFKSKTHIVFIVFMVLNVVLGFINVQEWIASRDIASRLGIGRDEVTLPELEEQLTKLENNYLAKSGRMGRGEGTADLHAALAFALEDLVIEDQELLVGLGELAGDYGEVPIRFSCKMKYESLLILLDNLSRSDRLINVEFLSVEKKHSGQEGWLSVVFDLRAYYTIEPKSDRRRHGLV